MHAKPRLVSRSVTTANNSVIPELTSSNLLVCGVGGEGHLHNECQEKGNTASKPTYCNCKLVDRVTTSLQLSRLQEYHGEDAKKKVAESAQDYSR
jgi:hypothetical protein